METWSPISAQELNQLLDKQLADCPLELRTVYERYRVSMFQAPIKRNGAVESVYVVARNGAEAMYYEDVEEGFNFSPLSGSGEILEHWCNQDELKYALLRWK